MKFLLVRRQEGIGCDYTIGCGLAVEEIEASSVDAALKRLRKEAFSGERRLLEEIEWARLVPADSVIEPPIEQWAAELEERAEKRRAAEPPSKSAPNTSASR